MIAWLELTACLSIYVVLTHIAMLSALGKPYIHDLLPLMTPNKIVWHCAVWFPVVPLAYRAWRGFNTKWLGRLSRLVLMKAILQFVTITPAPSGMRDCTTVSVFWVFSCANMMFSGQVALTMLCLQGLTSRVRAFIVTVQSLLVVVAGIHYTSDCLVAVLAVLYVETLSIKESGIFSNAYSVRTCVQSSTPKRGIYDMVRRRESTSSSASDIDVEVPLADEQI